MRRQPTIGQYLESLSAPHGLFRTLSAFEVERDAYGDIRIRSGNSAAVFKLNPQVVPHAGNHQPIPPIALKCYIKDAPHRERIYAYLSAYPSSLLLPARFLPQEVYVYGYDDSGDHYDAVATSWVDCESLEIAIRRAAMQDDREALARLATGFDQMSLQLLAQEWAHGDLKPENIMLHPDGRLLLIDYDAMFIPELAGEQTVEIGTLHYQHPARDIHFYNSRLDDYPIALISTSLHALALAPDLYRRYHNSDNIILLPSEIVSGNSAAYAEILDLFISADQHGLVHLAQTLASPTPVIDHLPDILRNVSHKEHLPNRSPVEPPSLFHRGGRWGFSDGEGRTVIEPVYDDAAEFSENLAAVRIGGSHCFIDPDGRVMIRCGSYEKIQSFSEGLAAVCRQGLWGYIDHGGSEVVEPRFERAGAMHEGLAVVKQNGLYGFIDHGGKWAIPPRFEYAVGFREGAAEVESDKKISIIDRLGRFLHTESKETALKDHF